VRTRLEIRCIADAEELRRAVAAGAAAVGLGPENVAAAIRAVRPFGVDPCSGTRRDGRLDPERLAAFAATVAET
jgi:phosphoribosylanthranilate isomerase